MASLLHNKRVVLDFGLNSAENAVRSKFFIKIDLVLQIILCKINSAIVFVCVRSTTSGFCCQIIVSRYMRRSLEKEFPVKKKKRKKSRMTNRSVCSTWRQFLRPSDVKDIFYHMRELKQLWSDCSVYQMKKRQNIVEKNMNMLREIGLQILKCWRFPLILLYRLKTAFLIGISWITFACIAGWCLPTCYHKHFWKSKSSLSYNHVARYSN